MIGSIQGHLNERASPSTDLGYLVQYIYLIGVYLTNTVRLTAGSPLIVIVCLMVLSLH